MEEQTFTEKNIKIPTSNEGLKALLKSLPKRPGVYKFLNKSSESLYIGKAKDLSSRIPYYFTESQNKAKKTKKLITDSYYLEVTLTSNELEALLLEQHLIKEERPNYNVQFKDDKGYPWIKLETSGRFPSATSYLGKKDNKSKYFGPYPNSYAVKDTLNLIQKTFKLRNCSDTFFKNRTRPCLQYEIGRCSAPCKGLISKQEYDQDVRSTEFLLSGKSNELITKFYDSMDKYSDRKDYEKAAIYRDKISALRDIQRTQSISGFSKERDAIIISTINGTTKAGITHVNQGWVVGHQNFIQEKDSIDENILESFIKNHYLKNVYCPSYLIIEEQIKDKSLLEGALSSLHNKMVKIISKPNKKDQGLLNICKSNTIYSLNKDDKFKDVSKAIKSLENDLQIPHKINLIESYDISHHSAKGAVGGCIVFSKKGKLKNKYRLFNISKENSGNDIASMVEIIERRFSNNKLDLDNPSLLVIDGGKIHLSHVIQVLKKLDLEEIFVIAISKGSNRRAEMDSIHLPNGTTRRMLPGSLSHLLIQEIRDEAHSFSISSQKKKVAKISLRSNLDDIEEVGPNRKKSLMRYFGTIEQIKRASIQDLIKVPGLGEKTATSIYNHFN
tara:strand:- start:34 stop:1875 length:1842 start_codon:yes stop_codon:yes gene_type:complete